MAIKKPHGGKIAMDKQRDFDLEKMDDWYRPILKSCSKNTEARL